MKTAYLFHDESCCLTDCMVRACTCGVDPVAGPDAQDEADALSRGANLVGVALEGGALVEWLSGRVDEKGEAIVLHFITSRDDDAADIKD